MKTRHCEKTVISPKPIDFGRSKQQEEMDRCVSCGKETPYPKNMHIDYRMYYVEGAGQLCNKCYENTMKDDGKNTSHT